MAKKTSLFAEHQKLGAKIVDFSGWEMPVMYSSIIEEHMATRTAAGIFDVSHMGEIIIKGKNASKFLKKIIPTNLGKLVPSKSMYSVLCNDVGGVIDDLFIYMISENEYFLVINAGTIETDLQWLEDNKIDDVQIINKSSEISKIDLQGPLSREIISKIFDKSKINHMKRFFMDYFYYKDIKTIISCTGYTGEIGYEIYIDNKLASTLWNELLDVGYEYGLKPVGLGARDTLRLESCYSLYGHELSETITPIEAGLKWIISSKDEYIGRNILVKEKDEGAKREIIAFNITGKGIPREHYKVEKDNIEVGYVTSGTFSPTLQKGIGLALVKNNFLKNGDEIDIIIRNKKIQGEVVKKPFYEYNGR